MRNRRRWFGVRSLVACAVILAVGGRAPVEAQDDGQAPALIELNRVFAKESGGKWTIGVNGRAPLVPAGAVLQLQVRYSFQVLEVFSFTLERTQRFDVEFVSHSLNGVIDNLYVSFLIPQEMQGPEVLETLAKAPERFPPGGSPWPTSFPDKPFQLGTDEQIGARLAGVNDFFRKTMIAVKQVAVDLEEARGGASEKSAYQKDGSFDSVAWQKFLEEKIRDPLRTHQREIDAAQRNTTYIDCQRDLGLLRELAAGVAARSYERSRSLYKELGMSVDPADMSPREIDINTKKQATGKYLQSLLDRLSESRGIELD